MFSAVLFYSGVLILMDPQLNPQRLDLLHLRLKKWTRPWRFHRRIVSMRSTRWQKKFYLHHRRNHFAPYRLSHLKLISHTLNSSHAKMEQRQRESSTSRESVVAARVIAPPSLTDSPPQPVPVHKKWKHSVRPGSPIVVSQASSCGGSSMLDKRPVTACHRFATKRPCID